MVVQVGSRRIVVHIQRGHRRPPRSAIFRQSRAGGILVQPVYVGIEPDSFFLHRLGGSAPQGMATPIARTVVGESFPLAICAEPGRPVSAQWDGRRKHATPAAVTPSVQRQSAILGCNSPVYDLYDSNE